MDRSLTVSELQSLDTDSPKSLTQEAEIPSPTELQLLPLAPHRRRDSNMQPAQFSCSVHVHQVPINARTTRFSLILKPASNYQIPILSSSLLVIEIATPETQVMLTKGKVKVLLMRLDHALAEKGETVEVRNMARETARLTLYVQQW